MYEYQSGEFVSGYWALDARPQPQSNTNLNRTIHSEGRLEWIKPENRNFDNQNSLLVNPLSPNSVQQQFSPNDIHTLS